MWRCPTRKAVKTRTTHAAVQVYSAAIGMWGVKTDHWFNGLFQSAPDLIVLLLPVGGISAPPSLSQDAPGDVLYRFDATELKAVNHRLDGVFWPRSTESGRPGFKHRLFAQTARFLLLHLQVLHLAVVVVADAGVC